MSICTVQVTNICPKATYRQMKELFNNIGDIDELRLFPEDEARLNVPSKVCFVTFKERSAVETALHLTNTLFIDRTLIVAQSRYEVIPEENVAMSLATPAVAASYVDKKSLLGSGINSAPLLPTPQKSLLGTPQMLPNPLASAVQQAQAIASSINANIQSTDDIIASHGASVKGDSSKNDEIRRTIYIGNLSTSLHPDEILNYFQTCGEIRYLRMAGDETQPTRFAFIEFANPESVQIALQYNGAMFGNIPIRVISSKSAIIKPHGKSFENSHKEVDDTSKRDKQSSKDERRRRSKTRSKSRERRKSRDSRRRRSVSPHHDRHRRRSPSHSPRRNHGHSPRRNDNHRRRRSRSRTPPPPRRHRSRSRHRRSLERDRRKYSRSRSKSRSPRRKSSSRKHKEKERGGGNRKSKEYSFSPSPSPERKKNKKSKKEKKHRKKTPSPSPSPSPSPPPRKKKDADVSYSNGSDDNPSDEQPTSQSDESD